MKKLVLLSIGMLAFTLQSANAQILFSTYDDWNVSGSWTSGGDGATAVTTFDYDGVTVNGLGNSVNEGGAGTAGSLQLNPVVGGYGPVVWGPGLTADAGTAMDGPNWIAPYSAASGYGAGACGAASGILTMNYTMPDNTFGGSYFQPGIQYNYPAGWGQWWATSETDLGPVTTPNGTMEMYQATIPYTISAVALGSLWGFQLGVAANTDFSGANNWYVDEIAIVPGSVTYVPEPGVMALIGVGLAGLMLVRRQKKS